MSVQAGQRYPERGAFPAQAASAAQARAAGESCAAAATSSLKRHTPMPTCICGSTAISLYKAVSWGRPPTSHMSCSSASSTQRSACARNIPTVSRRICASPGWRRLCSTHHFVSGSQRQPVEFLYMITVNYLHLHLQVRSQRRRTCSSMK